MVKTKKIIEQTEKDSLLKRVHLGDFVEVEYETRFLMCEDIKTIRGYVMNLGKRGFTISDSNVGESSNWEKTYIKYESFLGLFNFSTYPN